MSRAPFPSGRKSLLLLALAAAIIGGVWWWQRPPPEPVYHGERLSEWLIPRKRFDDDIVTSKLEELHAFGPGVVPWLAYMVEYREYDSLHGAPRPFDHSPVWLRRWLPERWGGLRPSAPHADPADVADALDVLGPEASHAIPALVRVLKHECENDESESHNRAMSAGDALHAIGPAAWPAIDEMVDHGNPKARSILLWTMGHRWSDTNEPLSGTEIARTSAALMKGCGDPMALVRAAAAHGIGDCCMERPDLIEFGPMIIALIRLLDDSDGTVRKQATDALYFCGSRARSSIPRLIGLLDDRDPIIRSSAAMALGALDKDEKRSAIRLRAMLLNDKGPECRTSAADALDALGLSPEEESTAPEASPEK